MVLNITGGLPLCPFEVLLGNLFCWPTFCCAKEPDFDCYYPAVADDTRNLSQPSSVPLSGPLPILQKIQITICIFLISLQLGTWIWATFYHLDAGTWYLDRGSKLCLAIEIAKIEGRCLQNPNALSFLVATFKDPVTSYMTV